MKKAAKDKEKKKVKEGAEEEAQLVMAAKDMVDKVTGWMEDTAINANRNNFRIRRCNKG